MIAVLLFELMLAGTGQAPDAAEALRLAQSGDTIGALTRFEEIAARHPADVETRIWIGRLQRRLGHLASAEASLRAAVEAAPAHVEALTELASVLTSTGRRDEAANLLDRAEALAPDDPAVVATRARVLRLDGRYRQAEVLYERAAQLSPDDNDIRRALFDTRRLTRHRAEATLQHTGTTDFVDLAVDFHAADRVRVAARLQGQQHDDAATELRGGGGVEWLAAPAWSVRAAALVNPGAVRIARSDVQVALERFGRRSDWSVGVRQLSYATASAWIASPAVTVWLGEGTDVTVRWFTSTLRIDGRPARTTQAGLVRLRRRFGMRLWIEGGYARGYEPFDTLSLDRLGALRTETWSGGARWEMSELHGVTVAVERERRRGGVGDLTRLTLLAAQRF